MIDRLTPTQRPDEANAGTQSWRSLLFAHWEVSVDELRAVVPHPLEIDTFQQRAFIGVVPFEMRNIRPRWLPKAFAFNFLETNVRTYVVHQGRPGVYFFSLDANSRLAVWAARKGWALPYFYAHMSSSQADGRYTYESHRRGDRAAHRSVFRIGQELGPAQPDTLEHFLLERYLLFTERKDQIYVGQVHHQPYGVCDVISEEHDDSLIAAAGLSGIEGPPPIIHYSPGVDVEVFQIRPATNQH